MGSAGMVKRCLRQKSYRGIIVNYWD
jgi:hypothetical protein